MDTSPVKDYEEYQPRYWVIVPAAGMGVRMGASVAKQYLRIDHRTILELTIERLHQIRDFEKLILALSPRDSSWKFLPTAHYDNIETVNGGDERYLSVLNALWHIRDLAATDDWVLVHDAVRPCITRQDIEHMIQKLHDDPVGGLLAMPVKDTVKVCNGDGVVEDTLDRSKLWLAATPQMFRFGVLQAALEHARDQGLAVTDEASAVEAYGRKVKVVPGRYDNIKVTHPEDLAMVKAILSLQKAEADD